MLGISNKKVPDNAYQGKLQTVKVLQTPAAGRLIAYWLLGIFLLFFIILFFPWQQNIRASGEVTAFNPADRPQTINTVIAGQIIDWRVQEGKLVSEGDTILVLSEVKDKYFDPNMLERLREQLAAKEAGIAAKKDKVSALTQQYEALKEGLVFKLDQINQKIRQKELKLQSDSAMYEMAKVDYAISQRQLKGTEVMYDSGVVALVKLESARSKFQEKQSKLTSYKNKYDATRNELMIEQLNLRTVKAEAMEKMAKSLSNKSATLSDIEDSKASLSKMRNTYSNMQIRNERYAVVAPQSGYLVKALKQGLGEMVKAGDPVATIMPAKPKKAIELYVKAMDISLLAPGRHVRLQFDGWPAIQFSGWPSVSVGTFGGKVEVIDLIDSKPGKYRILVTEEQQEDDAPWPSNLRLGSGVFAWVMLDNVPVWFEIWRQLNGFPPTVEAYSEDGNSGAADGKKGGKKEEGKKK